MPRKPTISFVGAGAFANGMAFALDAAGYAIREFVVLKPDARAKRLAQAFGAELHTARSAKFDADILWIAVPDDAIESCARTLAKSKSFGAKIVFHSSGALSSAALAPFARAGAAVASVHPMMSFSPANRRPALDGVWFAVEGDATAVRVATRIVRELGGKLLKVRGDDKALYHAFGAMAAPLMVSHLQAAMEIARSAGISEKQARQILQPMLQKVFSAFMAGGAKAAFSGPFLRGDVATIEKHVEALRNSEAREVYMALARYAVDHLDVANRARLKKLFQLNPR